MHPLLKALILNSLLFGGIVLSVSVFIGIPCLLEAPGGALIFLCVFMVGSFLWLTESIQKLSSDIDEYYSKDTCDCLTDYPLKEFVRISSTHAIDIELVDKVLYEGGVITGVVLRGYESRYTVEPAYRESLNIMFEASNGVNGSIK